MLRERDSMDLIKLKLLRRDYYVLYERANVIIRFFLRRRKKC